MNSQGQSAESGPLSLRVSVTDRCRLRCVHCTPAEGVERFTPGDVLSYEEIVRFVRLIRDRVGLTKVHVTGGEPLARHGIAKLVGMLATEAIVDLAMTTSGQGLMRLAGDLKRAGLRRVNVSLLTLESNAYRELTGGGVLWRTLEGIAAALTAGLAPVKCNVPVLRGINDGEVVRLAEWGAAIGVEVRFIELMPIGPAAARHADWFVPAEEILARLRASMTLNALPRRRGGSCREFRVGSGGTVGIIAPCSEPFCGDCRRLRLTATGDLVGCLARNSRASVRPLLRAPGPLDEDAILARVHDVMGRKRAGHAFAGDLCMVRTGG